MNRKMLGYSFVMHWTLVFGGLSLAATALSAGAEYPIGFGEECPTKGTFEVVSDTDQWADMCFSRSTGRKPNPDRRESSRLFRDVDLDGTEELLEARGTDYRSKTIYVFRSTTEGFVYIGALHAHPEFKVTKAPDGEIEFIDFHWTGHGFTDVVLRTIRYVGNEFVTVKEETASK